MKRSMKGLATLLAISMLGATALTGCGTPTSATSEAGSSTAASTNTSEAGAASGPKTEMTAMFLGSSQDQAVVDIIQSMTDKFNADNPYNVEFKFETYENEQYKTKLTTVMASNSAPDVFFTWSSGYLQPFVEGGKVYEIGQLLDKDEEWKARFNDSVFGPVSYDGKIYAVPHGQTVGVMFYNTRLFKENNIEVPKTYEDLKAACETLKAAGITPISVPCQDAWIPGQFFQQLANGVGGMNLYNGMLDSSRLWNDADYVTAGNELRELTQLGAFPDGYLGMTNDEGRDLFAQEKAAMYYMGSWDIGMLNDESVPVSKNIGVFNIPGKDGNVAIGDVDQCLAISANCKNVDAAAAYIKLFSGTEAQEAYAYNADYLLATNTPLDESKLSPLYVEVSELQKTFTGVTPWLDRVFGAGEGVEFNNAAQAIIADKDAQQRLDELQQFAVDNAQH